MAISRCLGLLLIIQLICPISSQPSVAENDIECLQATHSQLKDPLGNLYTWNFVNTSTKGFICNFLGITCWQNDDNEVLSISLQDIGLQGEFPPGVKYCGSMRSLTLSQNSLTGTIPKELCQWLPYLVTIDLSENQFTGSIPAELQYCTHLSVLHLNGNKLTGKIPLQFSQLVFLEELNVADNRLSGIIPSLFHHMSAFNFENNRGLCGFPLSKTCPASVNPMVVNPMVVLAFLLFGMVLIVWILLGIWWMISKAKSRRSVKIPLPTSKVPNDLEKYVRSRRSANVCSFEEPIRKFRLTDLLAATENFSEDNIILCGRTGILYKAKLPDLSLLAVKRLRPCSQTEKDFKCEMKALAHLRHRNLVPFLGYCIADEERVLVYKYMARGTLLNCLHGLHGEQNTLDLATRIKICMGTARGLAWLHHSCNPHVVHRNISSGIIFLDKEYEARISGFELARLMNAEDTCVPISSSGEDDQLVEEFGYDAPEVWRNSSVATLKGDVYSFGILVLEIVTGLRPRDTVMDEESRKEMTFLEWIHGRFAHEGDRVEQAIHSYRANQIDVSSDEWIRRLFVHEGVDCVQSCHANQMGPLSGEGSSTTPHEGVDCVEPAIQSCHANQMGLFSDEESSVVAEVMRLAFRCVNYNPDMRPSMYEVYKCFTKIRERYGTISDDSD
jgi:serine/threonine protein kinase